VVRFCGVPVPWRLHRSSVGVSTRSPTSRIALARALRERDCSCLRPARRSTSCTPAACTCTSVTAAQDAGRRVSIASASSSRHGELAALRDREATVLAKRRHARRSRARPRCVAGPAQQRLVRSQGTHRGEAFDHVRAQGRPPRRLPVPMRDRPSGCRTLACRRLYRKVGACHPMWAPVWPDVPRT